MLLCNNFICPCNKVRRVYWIHPVHLSLPLSIHLSICEQPCPLCGVYSFGGIFSIFCTDNHWYKMVPQNRKCLKYSSNFLFLYFLIMTSDTIWSQTFCSILFQVMFCLRHLTIAWTNVALMTIGASAANSVTLASKYKCLLPIKSMWVCHLQNSRDVAQASVCYHDEI